MTNITAETLETLRNIPTQTLIDGLWVMGWPMSFVHGAKPLQPGQHMAGRAVTLRFVPHRPDLAADKPKGADSAEYVAFELCGPENVLVIDAMGWEYSSIGGDIKFMRLMQRRVGGLVTDGAVRDSNALKEYGFPVYAANTTAKQGPAEFWPWQVNDAVQCGGVLVRPGDAVVGDDDGAVVVPAAAVDEVIRIAHEREEVEAVIKAQLEVEQCSPGKYYPFKRPDLAALRGKDGPEARRVTARPGIFPFSYRQSSGRGATTGPGSGGGTPDKCQPPTVQGSITRVAPMPQRRCATTAHDTPRGRRGLPAIRHRRVGGRGRWRHDGGWSCACFLSAKQFGDVVRQRETGLLLKVCDVFRSRCGTNLRYPIPFLWR